MSKCLCRNVKIPNLVVASSPKYTAAWPGCWGHSRVSHRDGRGHSRAIVAVLQLERCAVSIEDNAGSTAFHNFCQYYTSPSSLRKVRSVCAPCGHRRMDALAVWQPAGISHDSGHSTPVSCPTLS